MTRKNWKWNGVAAGFFTASAVVGCATVDPTKRHGPDSASPSAATKADGIASTEGRFALQSPTGEEKVSEPDEQARRFTFRRPTRDDPSRKSTRDDEVRQTGFRGTLSIEQRINTHLDLGRALESQGHDEAALDEYRRASEAVQEAGRLRGDAQERARVHRRLAGALDRLGRFEDAKDQYQAALKLAPKDPRVWNDAGYSAYLQGRWDEAERALRRAAELDPSDPRIATNLGLTLASAGKREAAMKAFIRAGDPATARSNMAFALAANGDFAAAAAEYRSALQLDPQLDQARRGLAEVEQALAYRITRGSASPTAPAEPPTTVRR